MKNILCISAVSMVLISSCSSAKINSNYDLQGIWVSQTDNPFEYEFSKPPNYYQFTFRNDSFFIEIASFEGDIDLHNEPFKSKGTFKISGDGIVFTGIAKGKGSDKFNLEYRDRFNYDYGPNYLSLYSKNKSYFTRYDLIRRSPIIK